MEDYTQANTYCEKLAAKYPENEHFDYYLGVCYYKLGNTDKAFNYFKNEYSVIYKTDDYEL
ncbi:MAG: tetratricopeptide repeat protein [Cytophagaceae bacterium]|nr:tetratricopeptide repeat protein [Cytophagaceae bacterium]